MKLFDCFWWSRVEISLRIDPRYFQSDPITPKAPLSTWTSRWWVFAIFIQEIYASKKNKTIYCWGIFQISIYLLVYIENGGKKWENKFSKKIRKVDFSKFLEFLKFRYFFDFSFFFSNIFDFLNDFLSENHYRETLVFKKNRACGAACSQFYE
jgi:hypothetical protein